MNKDWYKIANRSSLFFIIFCLIITAINVYWIESQKIHTLISKIFAFSTAIWMIIPLTKSTIILSPEVLRCLKIKTWRSIILFREYYKLTKLNNLLLHIGATLFFIIMIFQAVFDIELMSLGYATTIILSLSFLLDIHHRIKFISKKIWKGVLGKIVLTLYAALALTITNYLARRWIINTTNLDPKFFSEVVSSISIFLTPLSYIIITSFLCLLIIIPECTGLFILMLLSPGSNIINKKHPGLVKLSIRIRTGKRIEILSQNEIALLHSKTMFFRILSAPLFLLSIAWILIHLNNFSGEVLDRAGRSWLVANYYQPNSNNPGDILKYYEISESKTSIAYKQKDTWYFSTLDKPKAPH
ncbi:hypothetical protein [Phytobacter diazotrophicus]|uniref:hypothetical protein n=1 Tax=Phytobacter diazotrophicus TaxID=395631 RepID=UPI002FFBB403